jgi:hypothetical protein
MSTQGTGSFGFKNWEEQPFSEVEGGAKLARASVTNLYGGDVEGEGTAQFLLSYVDGTSGSYTGLEHVVGKVGGRSGSFVLQHSGTFEADSVTTTWQVVPGSGSGELSGLRGAGGFRAKHGQPETPYTLEYDLPRD